MILPLAARQATLGMVGGKATNLTRLAQAGFPVPDGFLITTDAYRQFVISNKLGEEIQKAVSRAATDQPAGLETISQSIRHAFTAGSIAPKLVEQILAAYVELGEPAVAVRSSATAEDLPDMSFAGQQDTFLNIINRDALLKAVVDCWSSLWTARAISYRMRNDVPHEDVTLAVVVQEMVPAEASGVLFTANPLTGTRTQTFIEATLGLGEALVSGQVEPDQFTISSIDGEILTKSLGSKATIVHQDKGGGVFSVRGKDGSQYALTDEQARQLAELGQRVAHEFGSPQDIEWAWADGRFALLQARPITTLYPVPDDMAPEPLRVLLSFASIQGLLGPITPLGQDAIRLIFAGGSSLFGHQDTYESQRIIRSAGERLWVDFTSAARNSLGRKLLPEALGIIEPTAGQAMQTIWDDPRLAPERPGLRMDTVKRLVRFMVPMWRNIVRIWKEPDARRIESQMQMEERIANLQTQSDKIPDGPGGFSDRVELIYELGNSFPFVIPKVFAAVIAAMIPWMRLRRLSAFLPEGTGGTKDLWLQLSRGLPHNVTTEMDLVLWQTAQKIRYDPVSLQKFQDASAEELAARYSAELLPSAAQEAISAFMDLYGMRGLGEIDLGRSRWREEPAHIMQVIQGYLQIDDETQAPDVIFERGAEAARQAASQLEETVRHTRGGKIKAAIVRWATSRFRALAGLRESPKFYIIRTMGIIRRGLLQDAQRLVADGVLDQPGDLFFLTISDLETLARGEVQNWKALILDRKSRFQREQQRTQIPRVLLSDGQALYRGAGVSAQDGETNILTGSPVSPGVVKGLARVVMDPNSAQLAPGEILVCRGTDPAWTPLFLTAGGLVTEVGGMMTHGSVVAREYGIPAVVGVDEATSRIRTGQKVRLDGTTGHVTLLEE